MRLLGGGKVSHKISLNNHIAGYLKSDKDFMEGIKKGVAACKAGKVKPWSQVKRELEVQ